MTQNDMILQYLREEGSITPMEALEEFGCMRLGARIYELKEAGIGIRTVPERKLNRYGKPVTYARYYLEGV
jgi:hypothetical protein